MVEHLPVEMAIAPSLRQIMEEMAIHPSLRQIMEEMAIDPSLRQRMVHAVKAEKGFTHQSNGRIKRIRQEQWKRVHINF